MIFRSLLRYTVAEERRSFDWNDPKHDPQGMYMVDCRVDNMDRPLFVHALANDGRTRDATIALLQFEKWGVRFRSLAIFEDQETINRKGFGALHRCVREAILQPSGQSRKDPTIPDRSGLHLRLDGEVRTNKDRSNRPMVQSLVPMSRALWFNGEATSAYRRPGIEVYIRDGDTDAIVGLLGGGVVSNGCRSLFIRAACLSISTLMMRGSVTGHVRTPGGYLQVFRRR